MAAYQYRIDDIDVISGQVTVKITQGPSPIPATWQGETIHTTKAEVLATLAIAKDSLQSMLREALVAMWKKVDSNLSNPSLVIGKTATLDFDNNGMSVTIV